MLENINNVFKIQKHFSGQISLSGSCPGTYDETQKELHSPNYPRDYGNNADCQWNIQASTGRRIEIRFADFRLEPQSECQFDWLQIHDGRDSSSPIIGSKMCGSTIPNNIVSSENNLHLRFRSDHSVPEKGFNINYQVAGNNFYNTDVIS